MVQVFTSVVGLGCWAVVVAATPPLYNAPVLSAVRRPDAAGWKPTPCGVNNQITSFGKQVNPSVAQPLAEYPRPQMARGSSSWANLNGMWKWQAASGPSSSPPATFNGSILVPFPTEACLSGVGATHKYMWYGLSATLSSATATALGSGDRLLLHFGAVDWQTDVWVNGALQGRHTGGYDGFSFDVTDAVMGGTDATMDLAVFVFDPSDDGAQPNGKQRISAITNPGGDTYTPASGIWQTVWLEHVPAVYVSAVKLLPTLSTVAVNASAGDGGAHNVTFTVYNGDVLVATAKGTTGAVTTIDIPSPTLWSPETPFLYDLSIDVDGGDAVTSYFGLRTSSIGRVPGPGTPGIPPQQGVDRPGSDLPGMPVTLSPNDSSACWAMCNTTAGCKAWAFGPSGGCDAHPLCWLKSSVPASRADSCRTSGVQPTPPGPVTRPLLNGKYVFRAGWLDQSYWPDGVYTAPTDEGLAFDLQSVKQFGFNTVRLHQKVNPERWYYYADTLGIMVLQDAVQKYGHASNATVEPFLQDLTAMMTGPVYSHPSVVQWETFNEEDCYSVFNVPEVVKLAQRLDPSRPVDTDSGGGANSLHIGDVNDTYAYPRPDTPSASQYAMVGEFGGIGGGWTDAHSWVPGKCHTYLQVKSTQAIADTYVDMANILAAAPSLSCSIYTQVTDVELECDGFINYDRSVKLNATQVAAIAAANQAIIAGSSSV